MNKTKNIRKIMAGALSAVVLLSGLGFSALADEVYTQEMMEAFEKEVGDCYYNKSSSALMSKLSTDLRNKEAYTEDILIKLDETETKELIKENLGVQMEMKTTYSRDFFENGELSESIKDSIVNDVGAIPMFRWGGTTANYLDYVANLGPVTERKTSVSDDLTYVPANKDPFEPYGIMEMGTGEFLQMQLLNNPESKLIACVSWYRMTPEKCEQLAHFFYDKPEESKWGKMRAEQYGLEEPIDVFYWEMGNEVDYYASLDTNKMDKYVAWVRDASVAIRKVNPDAKIIMCGPSAPWGTEKDWRVWPEYVFSRIADVVDAVSYHPYYDGYPPEMMMGYQEEIKLMIDRIAEEQDIRDKDGNRKEFKIVGTEGARYALPNEYPPGTSTFEAGICNIHYVNLVMQKPYINGNALHCLTGEEAVWPYWIIRDGKILSTPTEKMYHVYIDNLGDRIIASDWAVAPKDGEEPKWWDENWTYSITTYPSGADFINCDTAKFSVSAMGDGKNEVVLVLTNKSYDTAYNINLQTDNKYTLIEETRVEAPNPIVWTYNQETADLTTVITEQKNEALENYRLPPFTMAVLRLKTNTNLPLFGESASASGSGDEIADVELTDDSFKDIASHWAKNEIELMRQAGFVNGNGTGDFNPDSPITRGELYTIISRLLNSHGVYRGTAFSDVLPGDWFADGANTAYGEGIIRDLKFNAEAYTDFFEVLSAVKRIYENHNIEISEGSLKADTNFDTSLWTDSEKELMEFAMNNGLLTRLYESGELTVRRAVTKGEAMAILYRLSTKIGS